MIGARRRRRSLVAVTMAAIPLVAVVGVVALGGVASSQEQPAALEATDAGVGGFDLRAQSAPILMNLDTPTLALPRLVQLGIPYASTQAVSGPSGLAIGSVLWPGPVAADAGGALAQLGLALPIPSYPIRAQSSLPSDEPEQVVAPAPGVRMTTEARDEGLHAEATYPSFEIPGLFMVGSLLATSDTTLEEGIVRTRTRAHLARIEVLDGLIELGPLTTEAGAESNGERARATATLSPIEVTVGGQPAALGPEGITVPGREQLTQQLNQFLDVMGIEIRALASDVVEDDSGTASGDVSGVFLRFAPSEAAGGAAGSGQRQATAALASLLGGLGLPADLQNATNAVVSLLAADYRISLVFGSSYAAALASPGFGTDAAIDSVLGGDLGGGDLGTSLGGGDSFPLEGLATAPPQGRPATSGSRQDVALPPLEETSGSGTAVPAGVVMAAVLAGPVFATLGRRFGAFALAPPAATCPLEKPPKEAR